MSDLPGIVSARMPARLVDALKAAATARGQSVSDLLRDFAEQMAGTEPSGWACAHMNLTGPPGVFTSVEAPCGCPMRPIFHAPVPAAA